MEVASTLSPFDGNYGFICLDETLPTGGTQIYVPPEFGSVTALLKSDLFPRGKVELTDIVEEDGKWSAILKGDEHQYGITYRIVDDKPILTSRTTENLY